MGLPVQFIVATRRKTQVAFFFAISPLFPCFTRLYQAVGYNLGYKISMPPKVYLGAFLFIVTAFNDLLVGAKELRPIRLVGLKFSQNKLECLSERSKPTSLGATGLLPVQKA